MRNVKWYKASECDDPLLEVECSHSICGLSLLGPMSPLELKHRHTGQDTIIYILEMVL